MEKGGFMRREMLNFTFERTPNVKTGSKGKSDSDFLPGEDAGRSRFTEIEIRKIIYSRAFCYAPTGFPLLSVFINYQP